MRRRVLLVLVLFAVVATVAFAVPLALSVSSERTQRLDDGRTRDATHFGALAALDDAGADQLSDALLRYHEVYGESVLVVDARGGVRARVGDMRTPERAAEAVSAALRNQHTRVTSPVTPWSERVAMVGVPVGTGAHVEGAVVIDVSTDAAREDVARAWALIAAGTVAVLAAVTAVAIALSRWTIRPLTDLTRRVDELASAVPEAVPPADSASAREGPGRDYAGPPEVRELTRAFDVMSDQVRTSTRAQRLLVADTAHALRNPLAALTIRLDTLGHRLPDDLAPSHARIVHEVDRLGGIVEDLLTLAAAESRTTGTESVAASDEAPAERLESDVLAVVADRVDAWGPMFGSPPSVVDRTPRASGVPHGDRPYAAMPADDLSRVLDVLMSNAATHAPSSLVTVECAVDSDLVRVTVADTGPGVADADLARLTDRFFRGADTTAVGTGLGLPIARALVERAGGTLAVRRNTPTGLCVVIALPVVPRAG